MRKLTASLVVAVIIAFIAAIIYLYRKAIGQAIDYVGFVTSTKELGTPVAFTTGTELDPDSIANGLTGVKVYQKTAGHLTSDSMNTLRSGQMSDLGILPVKYARISWNYSYLTGAVRDFNISMVLDSPTMTPTQTVDTLKSISWLTPIFNQLDMPEKPIAWELTP
jgi:hypothetical protein